ncbi:MAG: class I SAM-dependent methyltransferase [Planctomycetota bacterium]|nr:class I SAM-dependent methyltransferase [Planctomycetota bacterium]
MEEHWSGKDLAVLDVACGDGFYAATFDAVLGPRSRIAALDVSPAFLEWASACRWGSRSLSPRTQFVAAAAERLPFEEGSFDLVWCAQSLISLPEPLDCLREMVRVTRPGGTVAILENDRLHELQLPWPPELEIVLRTAERSAASDSASAEKPHAGRFLEAMMLDAGLRPAQRISIVIDRSPPLSVADEAFLQTYLHELSERVANDLTPKDRDELLRLATPSSPAYLPAQPSFWMTWTDVVVFGKREVGSVGE